MHPAGRGQGLSPAVSTPIGFHGSSLICRICHCRGGLLLGGFKPCCHGSQDPSPPYGDFTLSLFFPSCCLLPSTFCSLSFFITPSCSQMHAFPVGPFLSLPPFFVLRARSNLRGWVWGKAGWSRCFGLREDSGREEALVCLDRCTGPSELLSVIKGADDVEQIHGPCLISPCCVPHPSS